MATAIRGYKTRRIMKKEYIRPEIVVEEFISEIYMQAVSTTPIKPGGTGRPKVNQRRGDWGNLWDQDENW